MTLMERSGVYLLTNSKSGKTYVGSAMHFRYRWNQHRSYLSRGTHANPMLQRAWNKYGRSVFSFRPLLVCAPKDLLFYEQRAIDALKPEYNLCRTAGSMLGFKRGPFSEEHRAKLRAARALRPPEKRTEAQRQRMAEAQQKSYGARTSPKKMPAVTAETKAKISAALTGLTRSAETRAKISAAKKRALPATEESRMKMSVSAKRVWAVRKAKKGGSDVYV